MVVHKLKKECDQLFLSIDRRLLLIPGSDPFDPLMVLGYNLRLMKDYADEILSFAHEYDTPNMPAVNGFWSWVRVVNNFARQVLDSFDSRGVTPTLKDPHWMRTSLILIHALDLVIKIRVDLIAQSSANTRRKGTGVTSVPPSHRKASSVAVVVPPSLFSPFESCFSEAILLYKQTMEDSDLGTKDKLSIWRTLMSLTTDQTSVPIGDVVSFGSSLIHDKLLSAIPIPYIPFLTSRSRTASWKKVTVTGCEWVVNAGQKKQIYRREDFNNKTYSLNYYQKDPAITDSRKTIVLYLRESWNECCRNLANDTGLPCIDVFSSLFQLLDFNESLQQLLDVYAWVTSRSARKYLGFRPDRVILVGHGMAGSLAVSLCVLVHETQQIRKGLSLPHAVVAIRSKFNYRLALSPSSALTFLTCMNGRLVNSVRSQMQVFGVESRRNSGASDSSLCHSYNRKQSLAGAIHLTKSNFPLASIVMYSQQHLLHPFSLIHSLNMNLSGRLFHLLTAPIQSLSNSYWSPSPVNKLPIDLCSDISLPAERRDPELEYEQMFYECPKRVKEWDSKNRRHSEAESAEYSELNDTMRLFNEITGSPLISPLLYPHLKELADVRLHLVPSHFDPALDDSISLCRTWAGISKLHLIEENLMDQYFDQLNAGKMLSMTHVHRVLVDILDNE